MENLRAFSVEKILLLTTALVGYIFLTRKKVSQTVGHVTDLYIYPLKGGPARKTEFDIHVYIILTPGKKYSFFPDFDLTLGLNFGWTLQVL